MDAVIVEQKEFNSINAHRRAALAELLDLGR
jgi:hypothetical protein